MPPLEAETPKTLTETSQTQETPDTASVLVSTFSLADLSPPATTKNLILTADFPLQSYESVLSAPFSLPESFPDSIDSLRLELFTFGYPPGFLSALGKLLPNLKSLSVQLQLIAGTTAETFADAVEFFRNALHSGLQNLTLTDVFVPRDFFTAVGEEKDSGNWTLESLEITYAFRNADKEFNAQLPLLEIPSLLVPSLRKLVVRINPESDDVPGVTPCAAAMGEGLAKELLGWKEEEAVKMRKLDLSAVAYSPEIIGELLRKFTGLKETAWALSADGSDVTKKAFSGNIGAELEELEVLAEPNLDFYGKLRQDKDAALSSILWSKEDTEKFASEKLKTVDISILRVPQLGFSSWTKGDEGWTGERNFGVELTETEKAAIAKREEGGEEGTRLEEVA